MSGGESSKTGLSVLGVVVTLDQAQTGDSLPAAQWWTPWRRYRVVRSMGSIRSLVSRSTATEAVRNMLSNLIEKGKHEVHEVREASKLGGKHVDWIPRDTRQTGSVS